MATAQRINANAVEALKEALSVVVFSDGVARAAYVDVAATQPLASDVSVSVGFRGRSPKG